MKLRIGFFALVLFAVWLTSGWWTVFVARSLVCTANPVQSDAILIENFDPDYLVFERASRLRHMGLAQRILVPVSIDPATFQPNDVALGVADVMARIARLGSFEVVPMREAEPISLNAARDVLGYMERERLRSVIVVSPLFRSKRSELVYGATLAKAGIAVRCEPARGPHETSTWTRSWHGIEDVTSQLLKLQYYRFWVLPFRARS